MREVAEIPQAVEVVARGFDPTLVTVADAQRVVAHAAAIENMAATVKALAAGRVADTNAWALAGFRSPAEWLAAQAGTTQGRARDAIQAGGRLGQLAATAEAARRGVLSAEQVAAVSDAATADPAAEHRLLDTAQASSVAELRDECARTKAAADPDGDATHARVKAQRRLRFWPDPEGGANLAGRTTPEQLAPVRAAVDGVVVEMFAVARGEGRREPRDAYAMDALVEVCRRYLADQPDVDATNGAKAKHPNRKSPKYLGILRVDIEAMRRGIAHGDERCEIAGLGPVPVSVALSLLGDAALHLVVTRGVDVVNVTSLARSPSVAMRTAILWRSPICIVAGCNNPRIEFDHRYAWRDTRHTRLTELDGLCHHHHRLKTLERWELVRGSGKRDMVPPWDPRHPNYKTPAGNGRAPP